MSNPTIEVSDHVRKVLSNYDLLSSFRNGSQAHLKERQDAAMDSFKSQGFPSTKHEEWKYTSVRPLLNREYATAFVSPRDVSFSEEVAQWWKAYENPTVIALANGHFLPEKSILPEGNGVSIQPITNKHSDLLKEQWGTLAPLTNNPFVALNTAYTQSGVFIDIPRNAVIETPIFIVHHSNTAAGNLQTNARTFIHTGENSQAHIIEVWANEGGNYSFENYVAEAVVRKNALLNHYAIQNDTDQSSLINFTQAVQETGSVFKSYVFTLSGEIVRNNIEVRHLDEHIESHMYGLYMLDGKQHVDNHTMVDHAKPNCYSNELYKGVLDGESTAVFNGKVMVRQDAQKTNAFQSNKTVLLTDGATINTKPQLEIWADDVKCSHGATTGRLDEQGLFYLRSRGLSERSARALLTYAFAAEVVENVTLAPLAEILTEKVRNRLF